MTAHACSIDGFPMDLDCACGHGHDVHTGTTPTPGDRPWAQGWCTAYVGQPDCGCTQFIPAALCEALADAIESHLSETCDDGAECRCPDERVLARVALGFLVRRGLIRTNESDTTEEEFDAMWDDWNCPEDSVYDRYDTDIEPLPGKHKCRTDACWRAHCVGRCIFHKRNRWCSEPNRHDGPCRFERICAPRVTFSDIGWRPLISGAIAGAFMSAVWVITAWVMSR